MTEKLKDRQYGKFGWITIADTEYDPVEDTKITWPDRKEVLKKAQEGRENTTPWSKLPIHRKMRERCRVLNAECRKKGIDGMAYDEYKALWDQAGDVEVLEGVMIPAPKLQKKFYQMEFRCVMARVDENSGVGYRPGNVVVVAVEGAWRNHRRIRYPKSIDILSYWRENGEVVTPEGDEEKWLLELLVSPETSAPRNRKQAK